MSKKKVTEKKHVKIRMLIVSEEAYDDNTSRLTIDFGQFTRLEILGIIAWLQIQREVATIWEMETAPESPLAVDSATK